VNFIGLHLPRYQPNWLAWLRREFAPFYGREQMTVRIVVTVVLVVIISMTLQVPNLFFSAYFVCFVTKENRALTMLTGTILMIGASIAIWSGLFFFRFTFDYPELRVPYIAAMIFTGMFLSRTLVLGPLGLVIGFVSALVQTRGEPAADPDALVRNILWLWVALVYPIGLTMLVNQVLLPAHPWDALIGALTKRLNTAVTALERTLATGAAGGQTDLALMELATRGSSPLLGLLNFAESKDAELKRRHASLVEMITASEHLLTATAALELRALQTLSPDDLVVAKMLLAEIAQIKTILAGQNKTSNKTPTGLEIKVVHAVTMISPPITILPQLRELHLAIDSFRAGLVREISSAATPAAPVKKRIFVPDAFTNPVYIHFALKVTLAAMICYLTYQALNWRGLSLSFLTCCFIALENTGATMRRGWLRLIGAAAGGVMGYIALLFFLPHMESITSLVLLTAAGTVIIAWVTAGTDRISHAGLQCAFAFYQCIFEGFAPDVNFSIARDRLVGIALGIVVSSIVYRYVWPEHAIDALRVTLARVLRNVSQLLQLPKNGEPAAGDETKTNALRAAVTKDLDSTLRLSEVLGDEDAVIRTADHLSPEKLERLTADTQSLCLMTNVLLGKTKLEEWQSLPPDARRAESELRDRAAGQLQAAAAQLEVSKCPASGDLEPDFSLWNQTVAPVTGNDRPRLIRRVVEQIGKLA
jgi:multidrug resistance protein MdtO